MVEPECSVNRERVSLRGCVCVYVAPLVVMLAPLIALRLITDGDLDSPFFNYAVQSLWAAPVLMVTEDWTAVVGVCASMAAMMAYILRPRRWTGLVSFIGTAGWYYAGMVQATQWWNAP